MAYLIQRDCTNVEHVIYEKNGDIGGTWLENRYPGCACDVPSHAYTYAFALNADWPKYLSPSDDIFRYLARVVDCFELRRFMNFNISVQSCIWNENEGQWHVSLRNVETGEESSDTCHVLIGANGLLNSWKYPEEVENLHKFKGRLVHTARWPDDYGPEQWSQERVAVLGSGASAIQVVPAMQTAGVKQMDVFVRTPVWFAELAGHAGQNHEYPEDQRQKLRDDTNELLTTARSIEGGLNGIMGIKAMMKHSAESRAVRDYFKKRMGEHLQDPEIFEQLLPNFSVGCRRLTPGDPFMKAVQAKNVKLHKGAVTRVDGNKVIGTNGDECEVDTLICATGFDVSYVPRYLMKGRNGVSLQEKWKTIPEGYMGLAVPDMPNYYIFQGPTFPVSNGSVMGPLQAVGAYIVQTIQKMQKERIHSFSPKQEVADAFNHHTQVWIAGSTWSDPNCRSWYKNNETGRVNAVWPGSSLHYCEMIETPRYEDFDIKYENPANMFAFMGLGFTRNQVAENGDLAPYMNDEVLEKKFYSFELSPDEEERIKNRKYRVHDGPERIKSHVNRVNGANGTHH
ncbi:hypothetical protein PRZ48_007943 [Zasmidium cellare]|uniref:Uncharacterized protein n=1 Tax=Zasmidium cellare TaxID=395010 RepID=A0ABR0EE39_ZASCE|nr:hypothetical protein PRZ48_007943 [Zasmidium cellare]